MSKKALRAQQKATPAVPATPAPAAMPVPHDLHTKWLWIGLAAIFVLMTLMSFSYGLSGDEVDMNEYGKAILNYFLSFGSDKTVFNMPRELDRDGVIKYYGGFFDLICAIVNKVSPFEEYTTRHILNAWTGFLAIFFAAKICLRYISARTALLCAGLMFLAPFFLGNAMNNPKDLPLATAYIAAVYFILRFFDHLPKPRASDYIAVITTIGIAINVRVAGILLIPYMGVYAGFIYISEITSGKEKPDFKSWIKPLLIAAILGYFAGSLFWPYGQLNPLINPLTALSEMSNFKVSLGQVWEGEKVFSSELPSGYLIKSFWITNAYVLLAGLVFAFLFLFRIRKMERAAAVYFVIFTGIFPLAYIIYKGSNVYHLWRHILFIFPSLAVTSAAGWLLFSDWLKERSFKWGMALAAVLLLEPAYFIVKTFPNTITYFNTFAGGVKGAYGNYEVDFYYNSLKQDVDWFKKNELPKYKPTDTVYIATNAAHLLIPYFAKEKNVHVGYVRYPERNQKKWDYSIFHIALIPLEEIKAGTWLPSTALYKASVEGKPLSAVVKRPSYDDLKGFEAIQKNQVDSTLYYFNNYLKADPDNIQMLSIMANIYQQLGRTDISQQYVNQINRLLAESYEDEF